MEYQCFLSIWLNYTSTSTIHGLPGAGGQAHIAFRRSRREVIGLLINTGILQRNNKWQIPLDSYGDISSQELTFYENPPHIRRAGECRIPSQSQSSPRRYPLWQRSVIQISRGSRPFQAILVLRDINDKFHARVICVRELSRLPISARSTLINSRNRTVYLETRAGTFDDIPCPGPTAVIPEEPGPSGSYIGRGRSRPQPSTDASWANLRRRLSGAECQRTRRSKIATYRRILRDPGLRSLLLSCFGERCQVRGCEYTDTLPSAVRQHVLVVHHIHELARGGTDDPYNLSVICANHHALCHYAPGAYIEPIIRSDDVLINYQGGAFVIERNLNPLRRR